MPFLMLRLMNRITARAWRTPALVVVTAAVAGWLLMVAFEPADSELKRPLNYLWYFFVSGTSTGYGDLYPETAGGRLGGVIVIGAGLSAGLVLFAELTLWIAKGRTLKANGQAQLHHHGHVVIIGYEREQLRAIIGELRADPLYAKTDVVAVFWPDQLSGENPDPELYDVVRFDDAALGRARLERAKTVLVCARNDDETVRVMLGVSAYLRRNGEPPLHLAAGLLDGGRYLEITESLALVSPDIEVVDIDDPAAVAAVIRNPGMASIYHNLASTLDSDGSLFRIDIPADAGEWQRFDLAVHLLRHGSTLLAVGESTRANARFRLTAEPGETVRGGQSLAVVAAERPDVPWSEISPA